MTSSPSGWQGRRGRVKDAEGAAQRQVLDANERPEESRLRGHAAAPGRVPAKDPQARTCHTRCDSGPATQQGAASQVGGDTAAGEVGGGPSLVAGSRSPSRRVRVPSRVDHSAPGRCSRAQQALHADSGWSLVVGAMLAKAWWISISRHWCHRWCAQRRWLQPACAA